MSQVTNGIPIDTILGDREKGVTVEESWSKDLPATGAGAPEIIADFDREKILLGGVKPSKRRMGGNETFEPAQEGSPRGGPIQASKLYHFFAIKGRKLELIGSKPCPVEKFAKDLSGRFFREWLKQSFPGRRDYDDICVWNDNAPLKEITDLLGVIE